MILHDILQWLAPIMTMAAASMTAANLGARVTGWGFVIFTFSSFAWILVGYNDDQMGLIIANSFLALVNMIGVWRWLGRQARYEAVGEAVEDAGRAATEPSVVRATGIHGQPVVDSNGETAGEAVEAVIDCETASVLHIIMRIGGVGGIGEQLVALPIEHVTLDCGTIRSSLSTHRIGLLPHLKPSKRPVLGAP